MSVHERRKKLWYGQRRPSPLNPDANLGQVLMNVLERSRDKVLQINADTGSRLTGGELRRRIVRVAQNLTRLGFGTGDRVSLACGNGENVVPVFAGCLTIGLAINPLAPIYAKDDCVHMMRQTQSRLIFCDESNRQIVEQAASEAISGSVMLFVFGVGTSTVRSVDQLLEPSEENEDNFQAQYLGCSQNLTGIILCSSGTTGLPKGVCLSHAHIIERTVFTEQVNGGPVFNYSPLFWLTGLLNVFTSLLYCRPQIVTSKPFDADALITLIETYGIELLFTAPAQVAQLLAHPRFAKANFASVHQWMVGGSTVPQEMIVKLQTRLPRGHVIAVYGSTEIGIITYVDKATVANSVGSLANNLECRVVAEDGTLLGPEEHGELQFRQRLMFTGYLNNDEATRASLTDDGFFLSGDLGHFDRDGYLYVTGRIKDIIKYRGFHISPSELENVIQRVDGVKQVCVVGVPSKDRTYELVTAAVERKQGAGVTEEDIVEVVNTQVSDFKQLRGGVWFVDRFPLTASGKILRREVTQMMAEYLSSGAAIES